MKRTMGMLLTMMVLSVASTANAEPQKIHLKDPAQRAKENTAKARIKNIDLRDVEDPAAQDALQEILNYLGLQTQK